MQFHGVTSICPAEPEVVAAVMEELAKEKGAASSELFIPSFSVYSVWSARGQGNSGCEATARVSLSATAMEQQELNLAKADSMCVEVRSFREDEALKGQESFVGLRKLPH